MIPIPTSSRLEEFLKPITVDVEGWFMRIPRPQRSGWLSIVIQLALVMAVLAPPALMNTDSWWCVIHPSKCSYQQVEDDHAKDYKVVYLSPFGRGGKTCVCHVDEVYDERFLLILNLYPAPTCDSPAMWWPREWNEYSSASNKHPIRYRTHCGGGPEPNGYTVITDHH